MKVALLLIYCVLPALPAPAAGAESPPPPAAAETAAGEGNEALPRPRLLWQFKSKGPYDAEPAVSGGLVVAGDRAGILTCLEADSGRRIWSRRFSGYFSAPPVIEEEKVYISVSRREVTVSREPGGGIFGSPPRVTRTVEEDGEIRCLDLQNGRRRWKRPLPAPIHSSPVPAGDRLVAGCLDYKIYCLDRATGSIVWEFKAGALIDASPIVCGGRVVAGSRDGSLFCLDLGGGSQFWRVDLGSGVSVAPVCRDGRIYAGADNENLYCLVNYPEEAGGGKSDSVIILVAASQDAKPVS
ncbi:MAG: PQQ-binding-like beta-propeller repeat protein, partial [PVC group bacterium]